MNWGAAVLLLVGAGVVVVGVAGSQKSVCQSLTGTDCAWLPNPSTETLKPVPGGPRKGGPTEPSGSVNIDNVIRNCRKNSQCSGYMTLATQDANNYGIDPTDFVRQIAAESSFNPNAKSPAGAEGIAQFMPSMAQSFGINPFDPKASLAASAQLMGYYERYWTQELNLPSGIGASVAKADVEALALSSYNYGLGGTQQLYSKYGLGNGDQQAWLQHAPQETQNYVGEIMFPGNSN